MLLGIRMGSQNPTRSLLANTELVSAIKPLPIMLRHGTHFGYVLTSIRLLAAMVVA
jgi:hypothetical protein